MAGFFKRLTEVTKWIGQCMDTFPSHLWESNDTAESKADNRKTTSTWDINTGRPKNYANSDIVDTEATITEEK